MKKRIYFALFTVLLSLYSCKKFIEVDAPFTGLNAGNVYTTDATAAAVLTDIYAQMSGENTTLLSQEMTSLSLFASLGADELTLYELNNQNLFGYYRNDLSKISQPNYWNGIYPQIFAVNNALEGLTSSRSLTPAVQQQLLGEAYFMRAFAYFYLVNLYGDVPLVTNLDYRTNALLSRTPKEQVYQQITTDLKKAQELLSLDYLKGDALTPYSAGSEERVRPTMWAATALLARTYLYVGDWGAAEVEATKVINHTTLFNLEFLNSAFLKNNREAVWQLQPVGNNAEANTGEGSRFILPEGGPGGNDYPVYLSNYVVNSFESGDQRKTNWIDSVVANGTTYYFPFKYKIGKIIAPTTEYPTILRLAELYLIRAEARIKNGKIPEGVGDLNVLRKRATDMSAPVGEQLQQLPTTLSKEVALQKVEHERRVELFTEWGHRWLDMKRTGRIDAVMSAIAPEKGGTWEPYKAFYPIPQSDIEKNPNLIQNSGYN